MQEGSGQQIRIGLTRSFQSFKHLIGMGLLGGLHPAKKDTLGRRKMGKKHLGLDPPAGAGQGIPELAGAVSEVGKNHGKSPAIVSRQKGL